MFGTSGIRGVVGKEITPELALKVGVATAKLYKKVVIGHDPRTTSIAIKNALISGLIFGGAQAFDVGLVSTPTLAYAARKYDIGVMITASHNPAEYNGIKIFNKDGSGISMKEAIKIEEMVEKGGEYVEWNKFSNLQNEDAIEEHMEAIITDVGKLKKERKIIVDCSNGSTSTITPYLLRKMGAKVITLNAQPDGFFPAHAPEPIAENLKQLKILCKEEKSFGIAHDCDGDRMVIVGRDGEVIPNEKLMVIFAEHIDAKKIAVPIDASMILDDYLDAEIVRTKVGDIFISEKLKEIKGDFGAEASGTWVFPSFSFCPDGIYAAAKFIKMLEEIDVMKKVKELKEYPIKRDAIKLKKEEIKKIMKKIEDEISDLNPLKIQRIDGFRIEFEDSWALIRASGTEPKIRITVESKDRKKLDELWENVMKIIKRCIK